MSQRPHVVAFDVIETVFALESMSRRFQDADLPAGSLTLFFTRLLRDAFALEASGVFCAFPALARAELTVLLRNNGIVVDDAVIQHILGGFGELQPHPDVVPALDRLREAGIPVIAVSNGTTANTEKLFTKAGLRDRLTAIVTVEDVQRWKPHATIYHTAARVAGVEPRRLALVAVHAWDTHGAKQAGLSTGWCSRQDGYYLDAMVPPDVQGRTLVEVVDGLLALPD